MGFEPMPLSRLAPKASALTTRPNLQHTQRFRKTTDNIAASPARPRGGAERGEANKKWKSVPGGTRTPNPQIRSLMRYPLRHRDTAWKGWAALASKKAKKSESTTVGFEPTRAKPINLAG